MVNNLRDFAPQGKQFVEMPFPACRIFTLPVTTDFRPVENTFDSSAYTAGGFSFGVPDGLKYGKNMLRVDVLN